MNIFNIAVKEEESGSRLFKITYNIQIYKQAGSLLQLLLYCQTTYYKNKNENQLPKRVKTTVKYIIPGEQTEADPERVGLLVLSTCIYT